MHRGGRSKPEWKISEDPRLSTITATELATGTQYSVPAVLLSTYYEYSYVRACIALNFTVMLLVRRAYRPTRSIGTLTASTALVSGMFRCISICRPGRCNLSLHPPGPFVNSLLCSVPGQDFWVSGKSSRDSSGASRRLGHSTWCAYELLTQSGCQTHTGPTSASNLVEEIEAGCYSYLRRKTVL